MKLILENIGSGLVTPGVGEQSLSPKIHMYLRSFIQLSATDFLNYEPDIRYLHTKKSGEVKLRLKLDDEIVSCDDVRSLIDADPDCIETPPTNDERESSTETESAEVPYVRPYNGAPRAPGVMVNYEGPINANAVLNAEA